MTYATSGQDELTSICSKYDAKLYKLKFTDIDQYYQIPLSIFSIFEISYKYRDFYLNQYS